MTFNSTKMLLKQCIYYERTAIFVMIYDKNAVHHYSRKNKFVAKHNAVSDRDGWLTTGNI